MSKCTTISMYEVYTVQRRKNYIKSKRFYVTLCYVFYGTLSSGFRYPFLFKEFRLKIGLAELDLYQPANHV